MPKGDYFHQESEKQCEFLYPLNLALGLMNLKFERKFDFIWGKNLR